MAQATDEVERLEGTIESYKGHGVWVPRGLDAPSIMEGALALEQQFDVAPFMSRLMAGAVLEAIRGVKESAQTCSGVEGDQPSYPQA